MKKLTVLFVTLMMLLVATTCVFAEGEPSQECTVKESFEPTETFEWTVTSDVVLDSNGDGDVEVTVTSASLVPGHHLTISCDNSIDLSAGGDSRTVNVTFESIVLSVGDSLTNGSGTATLHDTGTVPDPTTHVAPVGEYEGTLTFTATIE